MEKIHEDTRGQAHLIIDARALRWVCLLTLAAGAGFRGGMCTGTSPRAFTSTRVAPEPRWPAPSPTNAWSWSWPPATACGCRRALATALPPSST
ncbi:hypothetical protein DFAR_340042 [Desulfarculales bacterium]